MGKMTEEQALMFQPNMISSEPMTEMIDEVQSEKIYTEIFRAFDMEQRG